MNNARTKRIILFAGLPGVGKSTLAHSLAARLGGSALDVDQFKKEIVNPSMLTGSIDPPELRWLYYQATLEQAFSLLENGDEVVTIDEVFHLAKLRRNIDVLCAEKGVQTYWIQVTASYELVESWLSRGRGPDHALNTVQALKLYTLFRRVFELLDADAISVANDGRPVRELVDKILSGI